MSDNGSLKAFCLYMAGTITHCVLTAGGGGVLVGGGGWLFGEFNCTSEFIQKINLNG